MLPSDSDNSHHSAGRTFATTSWSMVLQAADKDSPDKQLALAQLCENYWYPLYAFVRRKGYGRDQAEDLTQAFFVEVLDKNRLQAADSQRGKFRSFLLSCLENFLANRWRAQQALKRGGGQNVVSIDFQQAENRYSQEPFHDLTAERIFDRSWALAVLQQALCGVQQQYEQAGKARLYAALQGFLSGRCQLTYKEVSQDLEISEGAVKVAVHRLRERYGEQLRLQVARTLRDPQQVDEELKSLFEALRC